MVRAVADALRELQPKFLKIPAYAEISIYELYLSPEKTMEWRLVAEKSYDRNVVATSFHPKDALGRSSRRLSRRAAAAVPAASATEARSAIAQGASATAAGSRHGAGRRAGGGPAPGAGTVAARYAVQRCGSAGTRDVQPRGNLRSPQPRPVLLPAKRAATGPGALALGILYSGRHASAGCPGALAPR